MENDPDHQGGQNLKSKNSSILKNLGAHGHCLVGSIRLVRQIARFRGRGQTCEGAKKLVFENNFNSNLKLEIYIEISQNC